MRTMRWGGLGLAALLALAACHKQEPLPPEEDNITGEEAPAENLAPPVETNTAAEEPRNEVKPVSNLAEEIAPSEDEQMREDADAVGMTSRVPVDDVTSGDAATNEGQ